MAALRGVNVDGVVRLLEQRGYIEAVGRAEGPGQPVLYGTTDLFLERLGLDALGQLPPVEDFLPGRRGRRGAGGRAPAGQRVRRRLSWARRRPKATGSRRCCPAPGWAAGGSATTSSRTVGSRSTGRWRCSAPGSTRRCSGSRSTACRSAAAPGLVHYLLNKPDGVVTTASDPQGRPTVVSLVPDDPGCSRSAGSTAPPRGCSCSRTTASSPSCSRTRRTGSRRSTWPRSTACRRPAALRRLREGVELDDGMTAPAIVGVTSPGVVRIVIHEGRNRQVRRMCDAVGHPVRRLVRTRIGPVADRSLPPGQWRDLTSGRGPVALAGRGRPASGGKVASGPPSSMHGRWPYEHSAARPPSTRTPPSRSPSASRSCSGELMDRNDLVEDDVISIVFTATADVVAMFPATAARGHRVRRGPAALCGGDRGARRDAALHPGAAPREHRAPARETAARLPPRRQGAPR